MKRKLARRTDSSTRGSSVGEGEIPAHSELRVLLLRSGLLVHRPKLGLRRGHRVDQQAGNGIERR